MLVTIASIFEGYNCRGQRIVEIHETSVAIRAIARNWHFWQLVVLRRWKGSLEMKQVDERRADLLLKSPATGPRKTIPRGPMGLAHTAG